MYIYNSSGEYILPLDGDDKIESTYIFKYIDIFNIKEQVDVVYCIGVCFGFKRGIFVLDDLSELKMLRENLIFCIAIYRRQGFNQAGGYNPNMIYGYEDWNFWLSIMDLGKIFYRIKQMSRNVNAYKFKGKKIKMIKQINWY